MGKRSKDERLEIVNKIIKKIAEKDRKFFRSDSKDRIGYFVFNGSTLFFVDAYTGIPIRMYKEGSNSYSKVIKQKRYFSQGGTMWGLINDFKDFIFGDDDANHNHGYGGLYCTHWGYTPETMKEIQEFAIELGYLKGER